jgi:hypothetical protein
MKKYMKEHNDLPRYGLQDIVVTYDVGLAAALGSVGYKVFVDRKEGEYFPVFRIEANKNTDFFINNYYQNHLMVDAHVLASNIEILGGIIPGSLEQNTLGNKMPLKISPKPTSEDVKRFQEEKEAKEEQNRVYENEEDQYSDCLANLDDKDISEIIDDEDIPY